MSNPTDRYGIQYPAENDDPWYPRFADAYQAFDTTVYSVEQFALALDKTTCVISCYPSADLSWPASTTIPQAQHSTICSAAPYGRFSGAFTVPASGLSMRLELDATMGPAHTVVGTVATIGQFLRVVTSTSVSIVGDSCFVFPHRSSLTFQRVHWSATCSLAAGDYTVELQHRAVSTTNQSSVVTVPGVYGAVVLWATPQSR